MFARLTLASALILGLAGTSAAAPLIPAPPLPATSPLLQTVDEVDFKWGVWIGNNDGRSYDDDDDDDGHHHWKKHKHKKHPVWHDDDDDDGWHRKHGRGDDDDDD